MGDVWSDFSDASFSELNQGYTGFLGADTALGPIFIAYAHTEGRGSWHFQLGRIF